MMQFEFTDEITPDQIKQHLVQAIDIPPGATRIDLELHYAPHKIGGYKNMLTLTLFDPHGFRGEGHRGGPTQQVSLSQAEATPGYLRGSLPAGQWRVVINTHRVLAPVRYRLAVNVSFEEQLEEQLEEQFEEQPDLQMGQTASRGPGWYRGNLHAHTLHSDGHWDVADLLAYAREEGFDFITISDHNTVSALDEIDRSSADGLLTMGGMELTTFYGHALALGVREWVDWRVRPGEREMADILTEIEALGGLFIIAHPMALGDPVCTGCDWQYADVMPGKARRVEIWNTAWGNTNRRNAESLQLWYQWLNQGYKMVATAGSDNHGRSQPPVVYGRDVVYSRELSETAILDAVRRGHLYLSAGPTLLLEAVSSNGESGMMGDVLAGQPVQVTARWENAPPEGELRWIVNGQVQDTQTCGNDGESSLTLEGGWCVVELRDGKNQLCAITNPIFVGSEWK